MNRMAQKVLVGLMVATLVGVMLVPSGAAQGSWRAQSPQAGMLLQGVFGPR